jgi:c-di-GMP-related signal transduction protein
MVWRSIFMDIFVARQPIFDRNNKVFGYELLYRPGDTTSSVVCDGDQATIDVIRNSFTIIGIDTLTNGKKAFVNFTQNLLRSDLLTILSPKLVVIEILEDVIATSEVIAACEELKARGFLLALDDYDGKTENKALIQLADIIKVDFIQTDRASRVALIREIGADRVEFLAEKVESYAEYSEARELGFKYFQGYFFSKPLVMSGRDISDTKITYLRIVQEIHQPEVNFEALEQIIKYNISLSYKILRLVNSAAFGLRQPVSSVRQALALLGLRKIKKCVTLIAVQEIGEDKPNELAITVLTRGIIGETLAPLVKLAESSSDLFLLGMFSLIDIMLDRPMANVLIELPLKMEIRQALLGQANRLREVFDLILCYEAGAWDDFKKCCADLGVEEERFAQLYFKALSSAKQFFS